jgi:hypothetical protein
MQYGTNAPSTVAREHPTAPTATHWKPRFRCEQAVDSQQTSPQRAVPDWPGDRSSLVCLTRGACSSCNCYPLLRSTSGREAGPLKSMVTERNRPAPESEQTRHGDVPYALVGGLAPVSIMGRCRSSRAQSSIYPRPHSIASLSHLDLDHAIWRHPRGSSRPRQAPSTLALMQATFCHRLSRQYGST